MYTHTHVLSRAPPQGTTQQQDILQKSDLKAWPALVVWGAFELHFREMG